MIDGRFFFKFYICCPADWQYIAVNQCYWIQFLGWEDISSISLHWDTPCPTIRHVRWLCSTPQPSVLLEMAQYYTSWYIYPRSIWVCHCLWPQKRVIVSLKMTGTSFGNILPCSKTPYPLSMFLLIWFMLIEEPTWSITIRPSLTFFVSRHHIRQNLCMTNATLDKRSRNV